MTHFLAAEADGPEGGGYHTTTTTNLLQHTSFFSAAVVKKLLNCSQMLTGMNKRLGLQGVSEKSSPPP